MIQATSKINFIENHGENVVDRLAKSTPTQYIPLFNYLGPLP